MDRTESRDNETGLPANESALEEARLKINPRIQEGKNIGSILAVLRLIAVATCS